MARQKGLAIVLVLALWVTDRQGSPLAQNASPPAPPPPRPPAEIPLARLTPDATIAVTLAPGSVASDDGIWTVDAAAGSVVRIDVKTNTAAVPIAIGKGPCASLELAFGSVWVPLCDEHQIARLDLKTQKAAGRVAVDIAAADGRIASSVGSVWVLSDRRGVLTRIDPDTNAAVAEIYVAKGPTAIAAGDNTLWVTSEDGNHLTRVNPHTNEIVETIAVGPKPGRVAVGEGGVWTLNRGDGSVTRVDPASNKVVATIPLVAAAGAGEIAAAAGSVWISAPGVPIVRIDPRSNRAVRFTGEGGGAALVAHGSLWVGVGPKLTWRLDPQLVAAVRP
jgi:virginiamycin B lyase